MTIIDDRVLPARPAQVGPSTDTPSAGTLRPFGLTLATPLAEDEGVVVLDDATYDPVRQLNVDATGRPWVTGPGIVHLGTTTDTRYDMTWVVDKD